MFFAVHVPLPGQCWAPQLRSRFLRGDVAGRVAIRPSKHLAAASSACIFFAAAKPGISALAEKQTVVESRPRAGSAEGVAVDVRFLTFNTLASCYKRVKYFDNLEKTLQQRRESEERFEATREMRHEKILDLLKESDAHVIFLQEFWFQDAIKRKYENYMCTHKAFYLKRPEDKQDGLCTFIARDLEVVDEAHAYLDPGDRVALLLHVRQESDSVSKPNVEFLAVNVHLTFPHDDYYRERRLGEVRSVTSFIDSYVASRPGTENLPVFVAGDFNDFNDDVYKHMQENRFESSFKLIHDREPFVTHITHRDEEVPVDYIWVRTPAHGRSPIQLQPTESMLLPREIPDDVWPARFSISDHRPLTTNFRALPADS
eukprot:tig00021036_g17290.t1